jgi:hypothetical protein
MLMTTIISEHEAKLRHISTLHVDICPYVALAVVASEHQALTAVCNVVFSEKMYPVVSRRCGVASLPTNWPSLRTSGESLHVPQKPIPVERTTCWSSFKYDRCTSLNLPPSHTSEVAFLSMANRVPLRLTEGRNADELPLQPLSIDRASSAGAAVQISPNLIAKLRSWVSTFSAFKLRGCYTQSKGHSEGIHPNTREKTRQERVEGKGATQKHIKELKHDDIEEEVVSEWKNNAFIGWKRQIFSLFTCEAPARREKTICPSISIVCGVAVFIYSTRI